MLLAENMETKHEIKSCSCSLPRTTDEQQLQNAAIESFAFTCLTYRNVQRFRNGPVHEFYSLKASQMSKVRGSSHEYPHVDMLKNQESSGTEFQR